MRKTLGLVVAAMLVFACGSASTREGFGEDESIGASGPSGGSDDTGALGAAPPPALPAEKTECEKMDIVFIVDDSGSMAEEQENLAANFPKFVAKIDSFKTKSGSKLDWRLAVTTTGRNIKYKVSLGPSTIPMSEHGDDGAFRMKKECGTTKRWVEKADANASTEFQCLAKAGTSGSGLEMPLYAAELALVDRVTDGTNAGFQRDDALLAVIILTDEDDCSREDDNFTLQGDACTGSAPVSQYKQTLDAVAKGAGRWATAVIAGEKSCESKFGKASEAKRLKEFVGLAGKNGTFSSICDGDMTVALEKALDTFDAACKALPAATVK